MEDREEVGACVTAVAEVDDDTDIAGRDCGAKQEREIDRRGAFHLHDDDRGRLRRRRMRDLDHLPELPARSSFETSARGPRQALRRVASRQATAPRSMYASHESTRSSADGMSTTPFVACAATSGRKRCTKRASVTSSPIGP